MKPIPLIARARALLRDAPAELTREEMQRVLAPLCETKGQMTALRSELGKAGHVDCFVRNHLARKL